MKNYQKENFCTIEKIVCEAQTCKDCMIALSHQKIVFRDRTRKTTIVFTGALVTLVTVVTPASAVTGVGGIVHDPQNYQQNLQTAIQAVQQVKNQYQQIQYQFQSLQNEALNLVKDQTNIGDLKIAFQNLVKMQNYMTNLVNDYTKAQAAWDRTYPSFEKMNGNVSATEYAKQAHNAWNNSVSSIKNSKVANAVARQNSKITQSQVDTLIKSSDSAAGSLQAAQIGNKLAYAQSQQLSQLIAIVTESAEAQGDYYMQHNRAREAAKKRADDEDWDTSGIKDFSSDNGVGLPEIKK